MRKNKGFTLIEVLVALVIFSVMAAGFSRYVSERAKQTDYLVNKTLAAIVASNAITEIQTSGQWPEVGQTTQTVSMADKQWQVAIDVQETEHSALRRLDVTVADDSQPLATLTGFMGKN